ncbi:MAG: outer membrane beta-barrel protein [Bdellovibrionaceae bacterium]|nr:outer membrane beta-barrel protein [Bdellovibrionales bacterium]MCB9084414.1 outer membrane beta-barrel protein [Pseudobdellovibrionaceae bacterium]
MKQIFLTLLVSGFVFSAIAETVYVAPTKGSGVDPSSLGSITELIRASVAESDGYELVDDQNSAEIVLKSKALRLGDSYILSMVKYVNKKKTFGSKLKAASLDDMDTVSGRLVRAVLSEVKAEKDARVSDVTQDEETRGTRRKKATRQWELSFGPASPGNLNSKSDGINWKFGYLWGIDDRIDLKFSWEMLTSTDEDDVNFTDIYLGMNYFFSDANNAPYITGDFGYGGATAHDPNNSSLFGSDDDATGFALGFGVGMKFLRVSTVNVGVQLRHAMMFSETEHTKKKPYVTSLMLSAYF